MKQMQSAAWHSRRRVVAHWGQRAAGLAHVEACVAACDLDAVGFVEGAWVVGGDGPWECVAWRSEETQMVH
jgi:hypothetical protein